MEKINLTYQQASDLVAKYISDPITKLHLRETEIFMRGLAKRFNENEEEWGIIGLLHDIDWDLTKNNQSEHCVKAQEILKAAGANDFLIESIISHGYGHEINKFVLSASSPSGDSVAKIIPQLVAKQRSSHLQYCLAAAETLTGLIIASALVQPSKKLQDVSLQSLKNKFKTKSFAAKCNRDIILECEKAGISLDEFLQTGLSAMQSIAGEIGL